MLSLSSLIPAALMAAGVVSAQNPPAGLTISSLLASTPDCALPCVMKSLGEARCSMTNVTLLADCMCTNVSLQSDLSTCVQTSCSFDDQVSTGAYGLMIAAVDAQSYLCTEYPKESRVHEIRNAAIVSLALTVPTIIARCAARLQLTKRLWLDDWISILASVCLLAISSTELASAQMGFGLHYWNVDPNNGTILLQLFYVGQIIYILIQVFAKVAILVLFKRVFIAKWFQRTVNGFIIFMLGHGLIFIFVIIFQCTPIAANWDHSLDRKCLNVNAVGYVGAAFAIIEDIALVVLPIPELRKLQHMCADEESDQTSATVTSMIRLKYMVQFSKSFDTTWDNVDVLVWSLIETLSAVICGSLPSLRPWFGSLLPSITISWGRTTRWTSRETPKGSKNSSSARCTNTNRSSALHRWSGRYTDKQHAYPLSPLPSSSPGGYWKDTLAHSPDTEEKDWTRTSQLQTPSPVLDPSRDPEAGGFHSGSETDLIIQGSNRGVHVVYDIQVSSSPREESMGDHAVTTRSVSVSGASRSATGPRREHSVGALARNAGGCRNDAVTSFSRPLYGATPITDVTAQDPHGSSQLRTSSSSSLRTLPETPPVQSSTGPVAGSGRLGRDGLSRK